jgi:tetratricopeptide (TPR) repeat protein
LHETLHVVGEADSLWHQGQMYDDNTQLARTYSALHAWRAFYADEYAHACYHYGKLLRAKEDPVSAMQVFINATHSGTKDYHILGRVYNNIGDICHRANEFDLSYNMFKRSAEIFLSDKDTLSYYYCLNDMAYELAEQGKKDETFEILANIECHCSYEEVLVKIFETKAVACLYAEVYDSVIYYTSLYTRKSNDPNSILLRAQAYSFMGENDSATYYADSVLAVATELNNISNALYVLTNNDATKDKDAIREVAADRADAQKLIEIQRSKLAQAVQLLELDLHRKPNLVWLYATFITLIIIGAVLLSYVMVKRRRHQLLSQKISDLEIKNKGIIEQKRTQIEAHCMRFSNSKDIKSDLCWSDYEKMCDIINQYFYLLAKKLQLDYNMSEREVRVCVLSLFDFGYERMADLLFYAPTGVGKLKVRVARKVGTTAKNLRHFLIEKAINN